MADRKKQPKTPKAKSRRGFFDVVNALLTLFVVAVIVAGGLVLYGVHSFYAPGPIKADTDFVVEKGANLNTIGQKLEAAGLIDNRYVFDLGGFATKKLKSLKAGEYRLTANASMDDVLKELTEGRPVQHGVTIPEGFTIAQVVDRLNENTDLTGELSDIPPEGGILPQTYNFQPGASRQSVLDEMVAAQQKTLDDVWAGRDTSLPLDNPQQLVTLASIVEKETGLPAERGHVAAVFVNRLKKPMRLQSDPTVIYGITKGQAPLGRPLKRSEIEAKTPYNTYQVNGLPPTPIDNPGVDSLKAVANPDNSKDLYFVAVSTSPSDGHIFAASYADQQMNVRKLRAAEKLAAADAEADDTKDELEAQQAAATGDSSADGGSAAGASTAPSSPAPASQPEIAPASAPKTPAATAPAAEPSATPTDATPDDSDMPDPTRPANDTTSSDAPPAAITPAEITPAPVAGPTGTAPAASAAPTPATPAPTTPPAANDDTSSGSPSSSDTGAPLPMPANARPDDAEAPSVKPAAPAASHAPRPAHAKPKPADTFGG